MLQPQWGGFAVLGDLRISHEIKSHPAVSIVLPPDARGNRFGEFFRYHGWLAPGVRLFRSIGFRAKALWVALAFVIPLAVILLFLWSDAQERVATARSERQGLTYVRPLLDLVKVAQDRRRVATLQGAELASLQEAVKSAFAKVQAKHDEVGKDFEEDKEFGLLVKAQQALLQSAATGSLDDTFKSHSDYIAAALDLVGQISNGSQLALDPDLDTYHMMNLSVLRGPLQYENTDRLRGLGTLILMAKELTPQRRDWMTRWEAVQDFLDKDVETAYHEGIERTPEVAKLFDMKGTDATSDRFREVVNKQIMGASLVGDAETFRTLGTAAVDKQIALANQVMERLDVRLQERIDRLQSRLDLQLGLATAFIMLAGYLVVSF